MSMSSVKLTYWLDYSYVNFGWIWLEWICQVHLLLRNIIQMHAHVLNENNTEKSMIFLAIFVHFRSFYLQWMWTLYCETSHNNIMYRWIVEERKIQSEHLTPMLSIESYHLEQMTVFFESNSLWISNRIIFSKWKSSNLFFRPLIHPIQENENGKKEMRSCKNKTSTAIRSLVAFGLLSHCQFPICLKCFLLQQSTPLFAQFPGKFPTFLLIIRKALWFYLPMLFCWFSLCSFFILRMVFFVYYSSQSIHK